MPRFVCAGMDMIGLGTLINVAGIVVGGLAGLALKRFITERYQSNMVTALGLCTIFIGIIGTCEEALKPMDGALAAGGITTIIASLTIGMLIGTFLRITERIEALGEWLKARSGSSGDAQFVRAFVVASLTVSIGAMAVVGSLKDGLTGDISILTAKAVMDMIFIAVMTASLGKGCIFSAVPVAVLQGAITLMARFIEPYLTTQAISNISLVGSILIFCVGANLIWGDKIRLADLLPSLVIAVLCAFV
ncbi:MAG: DUF554 domain-containing protein [Duodenibacillus sp.]